ASRWAQRTGRRCLARSYQRTLWNPRHARAADHRPHRKPWLHSHDQLGRTQIVANVEAGLQGCVPGLMGWVSRIGWIVVIAVLIGAFSIFAYNIGYRAGHGEVTV